MTSLTLQTPVKTSVIEILHPKKTNIGGMALKAVAFAILGAVVTGIILAPIGMCYTIESFLHIECVDSMWIYLAISIPTMAGLVMYGYYKKGKKTIHATCDNIEKHNAKTKSRSKK